MLAGLCLWRVTPHNIPIAGTTPTTCMLHCMNRITQTVNAVRVTITVNSISWEACDEES